MHGSQATGNCMAARVTSALKHSNHLLCLFCATQGSEVCGCVHDLCMFMRATLMRCAMVCRTRRLARRAAMPWPMAAAATWEQVSARSLPLPEHGLPVQVRGLAPQRDTQSDFLVGLAAFCACASWVCMCPIAMSKQHAF